MAGKFYRHLYSLSKFLEALPSSLQNVALNDSQVLQDFPEVCFKKLSAFLGRIFIYIGKESLSLLVVLKPQKRERSFTLADAWFTLWPKQVICPKYALFCKDLFEQTESRKQMKVSFEGEPNLLTATKL